MNIEQVVAEMPKAENPKFPISTKVKAFRYGTEYQCQLLAELDWRKVPSKEEFEQKFCELVTRPCISSDLAHRTAQAIPDLHRWLLEGE